MSWPNPDQQPSVKMVILSEDMVTKRQAICWVTERQANVGTGIGVLFTDGSRSGDGRVGAIAVCKQGDRWNASRSPLGTRRMEVQDEELWAIGLALRKSLRM
jgi:hypothetical protein